MIKDVVIVKDLEDRRILFDAVGKTYSRDPYDDALYEEAKKLFAAAVSLSEKGW